MQERKGNEITQKCMLSDLRARYLHAMAAVFAEAFEKGYLNGEQHAAVLRVISECLDHTNDDINDFPALQKLVCTAPWLRLIVNLLAHLGCMGSMFLRWRDKVP